jgi:hypothetical protein
MHKRNMIASLMTLGCTLATVQPAFANEPTNNNYSWSGGANTPWTGNMTVFSTYNMWTTWPNKEAISPSNDVDYLLMTCGDAKIYVTGINLVGANGDLDVQFYTPNGTYLGSAAGTGDSETYTFSGFNYSTLVIRVYGYNGATNSYTPVLGCN